MEIVLLSLLSVTNCYNYIDNYEEFKALKTNCVNIIKNNTLLFYEIFKNKKMSFNSEDISDNNQYQSYSDNLIKPLDPSSFPESQISNLKDSKILAVHLL